MLVLCLISLLLIILVRYSRIVLSSLLLPCHKRFRDVDSGCPGLPAMSYPSRVAGVTAGGVGAGASKHGDRHRFMSSLTLTDQDQE